MPYTSQARQDEYDYLRWLSRHKMITPQIFSFEKAKIDRREAKSVAVLEAKRQRKEQEALVRREAKKAITKKRNEDKAEAKKHEKLVRIIPAGLLRDKYKVKTEREVSIRDMWKKTVGTTVRFIGGRVDATISVGTGDKGYKAFRTKFINGSDDYNFDDTDDFIILEPTNIEAEKLVQRFRDGITHCVFTPVISKLRSMIEEASPSTKTRLNQRIRKLLTLSVTYFDGVPESKMDEVAKASGLKIHLHDVLGNDLALYNKDGRVGCIRMTNTRENHVDIGMVVDSDPMELEQDEMITLWKHIKNSKKFYMIDGDLKEGMPTKIRTLDGAWRVKDSVREACVEFDKDLGIINYKINAKKQPDLNLFLKAGRIINGWSTI